MYKTNRELRDHLLAHVRRELEPCSFQWTEPDTCRVGRLGSPLGRKTLIDVIPVADIHRTFGGKSWSPDMAMEPESEHHEFTLDASKVDRARWLHENEWWHILIVVWPVKVPWPEGSPDQITQGWVHNPLGWNGGREISQAGKESPALRFKMPSPGFVCEGAGFHDPGFDKRGIKWDWAGMWDGWVYRRVDRLWNSGEGEPCGEPWLV